MILRLLILLICIVFLFPSLTLAASKNKAGVVMENPIKPASTMINGSVSVSKDLPAAFYGEWSVVSIAVDTNNPEEYWGSMGKDNWVFARNGKTVALSNPKSGAIASITVTEVVGNKAKFTREKVSEDKIITETVEIVIAEDRFSGFDTQIIKFLSKNKIYKTDVVKYKLGGRKISGPAMKDMFVK